MSLPENRLLAALPPADFARLTARMTDVKFEHKGVVYRANAPIEHVYFPRSGMISAVIIMLDGATAEVAAVGAEGMLGVSTFLGATRSAEEVFCQIPVSECRRLPVAEFVAEAVQNGVFRAILQEYVRGVLNTSSRMTACNCLHSVDGRCARWLLMCRDRVGSEEFPITQEFLATMLGVRRATVTAAAGGLAAAELISYRHGRVKVLDVAGLEKVACECYAAIRGHFDTLA